MTCFLIVGGAGYIGSHACRELTKQGYGVVVLDKLSKGHRQAVGGVDFVQGDKRARNQESGVGGQEAGLGDRREVPEVRCWMSDVGGGKDGEPERPREGEQGVIL